MTAEVPRKNDNSALIERRYSGFPYPLWQRAFFDHLLRSDESYEQKWQYVLNNPVRAGLVRRWEHWPYAGELHPLAL